MRIIKITLKKSHIRLKKSNGEPIRETQNTFDVRRYPYMGCEGADAGVGDSAAVSGGADRTLQQRALRREPTLGGMLSPSSQCSPSPSRRRIEACQAPQPLPRGPKRRAALSSAPLPQF